MKTILAESRYNEEIYLDCFKEDHVLTELQILPFESWLQQNVDTRMTPFPLLEACRKLQPLKEKLPILGSMLKYPAFIEQVLAFSNSLQEYHLCVEDLPRSNAQEKEMKLLVEACESIVGNGKLVEELLEKTKKIENVSLYEFSIESLFKTRTKEELCHRGLTLYPAKKTEAKKIEFYHALNSRQEIEACAQMICVNELPLNQINVILCNPNETLPYLEQIFTRYQISYGIVSKTVPSKVTIRFVALCRYLQEPTQDHFIACLKSEVFEGIDSKAVQDYLDLFCEPFDLSLPFNHVSMNSISIIGLDEIKKKQCLQLEEKAEEARCALMEILEVNQEESVIYRCFEYFRNSEIAKEGKEKKVLFQIQSLCNACGTPNLSDEELECVLAKIAGIQIEENQSAFDKVQVSDCDHPISSRQTCFVLAGNSKNYPGVSRCSGIFEEEYVAKVKGYPTKFERAEFNNQFKKWIFEAGENLILSYATSTYEGKGLECSFEIKSFAKQDSKAWPLIQNDELFQNEYALSEDLSKKIFIQNGKLKGSVSSFERYFRCPYSYFLATGLKLRKRQDYYFDLASIGSLQHSIIEECIRRWGSDYAQVTDECLMEIIQSKTQPLASFYTTQAWKIGSIQERCFNSLKVQFEFLNDLETNNDLLEHHLEVEFKKILFEDRETPIELSGIIDRIDANRNLFRIIDYKSSTKKLSTDKIESGLQLQLLTYLMIATELMKRKPAGAYYYSLKNDDVPIVAAQLNLRSNELTEKGKEEWFNDWFKAHRLTGKTTDESLENDNTGTHIVGWSKNGPGASTKMDYDELQETLLLLYTTLQQRILKGEISCTPVEGSCAFCDYGSICRYNGQIYRRNVTNEELREGENQDANVE